MPAVKEVKELQVVAVAEEYAPQKLEAFCADYQLEGETSFRELIQRGDLDAIYVPQPPALHFKWAKEALEAGKHVLIEKPSTTNYEETKKLVELAREKKLVLHENYMFQYHSQIGVIKQMVSEGVIGELRLMRANFGFPLRAQNDFRYVKDLGGGALLDAGGYTMKLATLFLGDTIKIDSAHLLGLPGYEVDMYGNASLSNDKGMTCQIGFGMDNSYQCSLELWGSKGRILTDRIFTAPPEFEPKVVIENAEGRQERILEADRHFMHSIEKFVAAVNDEKTRNEEYEEILLQARLVEEFRTKA